MKYTDFRHYSHAELRTMAQALNPGEVMAAADPWRRAADTLKAIRTTLTRASTEAATSWEGTTSDAFHARMLHLAATINNAASYANDAAITLKAVSEAIAKAKRDMPEEPGGWDQLTDGVGDTFSALFGADDEDSRTALADQRKLEAATVMQTLAMHYRTAAPMLKPPQPMGTPTKGKSNERDDATGIVSDESSGFAALGGAFGGTGLGGATIGSRPVGSAEFGNRYARVNPGRGPDPGSMAGSQVVSGAVARPLTGPEVVPAPSDPGVKGGVPLPPPTATGSPNFGAGTAIDGVSLPQSRPASHSSDATGPLSTSQPNSGFSVGAGSAALPGGVGRSVHQPEVPGSGRMSGPIGDRGTPIRPEEHGAGSGRGPVGARGVAAFGADGFPGGGVVSGGRGSSAADARGAGTVVGVGDRSGPGSGSKKALPEGGSGAGVSLNRVRTEPAAGVSMPSGPMVPLGSAQRRRKDEAAGSGRPAYLVEDGETWAPEECVNPPVVK
ncbi:hypothetical protein PUR61_35410 [Streptomyces sp. BE20]|uniref:PPE domain-containing protein n=1 Tax=Streptomyces sp. BE20 TaxID=3002525 RepID=UPI002E78D71D|nr:hypothetical protein [Streptomyces sp. BE20]MEE1827436.1 hypothetical protein [Streptomyces sp. BE20]